MIAVARFTSTPDTFFVEELPAYLPAGEGSHTFVWMEKRGLTTLEALARLARALGVQARLHKPVILEGNALYTHLSWHVITRGSPYFDQVYFGRREFTLRFKGVQPAEWAKNLLTGDVGWFPPTSGRRQPTPSPRMR